MPTLLSSTLASSEIEVIVHPSASLATRPVFEQPSAALATQPSASQAAPPSASQATRPPSAQPPATQPPAPPTPEQAAEQAAQSQGAAPGAPTAADPVSGAPVGVNVPGVGVVVPMTRDQLSALSRRGDMLSTHLRSAQGRRNDLVEELEETSSPTVRAGLEERIKFLDERLLTIEQELAVNSSLRASIAATLPRTPSADATTAPSSDRDSDSGPPGGVIALLVLLPISIAIAGSIWRRSTRRSVQAALPQAEARFVQLEQAIDTVAVEIERVAEGQRFVTKLLREGQPVPDFSVGRAAEGVGVRPGAESGR